MTKADFLAELRGKSGAGGAAAAPAAAKVGVSASEQAAAPDAPAWDALQDDYASLQSGLRMKVRSISNPPLYCTHESEHVCSLPEAPMRDAALHASLQNSLRMRVSPAHTAAGARSFAVGAMTPTQHISHV